MPASKPVALVTGGNKGIGFEICRGLARAGLSVLLGARDPEKGEKAAKALAAEGLDVAFLSLDVASEPSIRAAAARIEKERGCLDALVNNAGVFLDKDEGDAGTALTAKVETVRRTMETNVYGPLLLCQAFVPLMEKCGYGRIVNLSSGLGQLSDMQGAWPGYRLSKAALNALTRILAAETAGRGILVNAMCPGWVRTDMGGEGAPRTAPQGADTAVWLGTLPDGGPTGGFFRDRRPIPW